MRRLPLLPTLVVVCSLGQIWAQFAPRCVTPTGEIGGCVTSDRCDPGTVTMYDDGSGIINPRLGMNNVTCIAPQICCAYHKDTVSRAAIPGDAQGCGVQKRQTVPGFVKTKDTEADPGEFPWSVCLFIKIRIDGTKGNYRYAGTGSLIHDRVVLTAAHVLHNKDIQNLAAVFGDHDYFKRVMPKKMMEVREVVFHNKFNSGDGDYNFALAFLRTSASEGLTNVGTVCLPSPNYNPTVRTQCVFAGWTAQNYQLMKTDVPMLDHDSCEQKFQLHTKLGPGFRLLRSLTCAGGELRKNLCQAGGGSPLVCPIEGQPGRYVQTGIMSWGTDSCGEAGDPAAFADVAVARPWIDQELSARQMPTTSYTY